MKNVLITGSNRGLGYKLTQCFLERGYSVTSLNRTKSTITHVNHSEIVYTYRDEKSLELALRSLDTIDIFIHCAGARIFKSISQLSEQEWSEALFTQVTYPMIIYKCIEERLKLAQGSVYLMGSNYTDTPAHNRGAYNASKFALEGATRVLKIEAAPHNISVINLKLGGVNTSDNKTETWQLDIQDIVEHIEALESLDIKDSPAVLLIKSPEETWS